jgi:hypothetical protein
MLYFNAQLVCSFASARSPCLGQRLAEAILAASPRAGCSTTQFVLAATGECVDCCRDCQGSPQDNKCTCLDGGKEWIMLSNNGSNWCGGFLSS